MTNREILNAAIAAGYDPVWADAALDRFGRKVLLAATAAVMDYAYPVAVVTAFLDTCVAPEDLCHWVAATAEHWKLVPFAQT